MSINKPTIEYIKFLGWIDAEDGVRANLYGITNHPVLGDRMEDQAAVTSPVVCITYPRNRAATDGAPSMIETVNSIFVLRRPAHV